MKRILIGISLIVLPGLAQATDFSTERAATWGTFKTYYIEAYKAYPAYGLVFDPSVSDSSKPDSGDYAVSEGVGYGLLLAVLQNDQATFDKIFIAANKFMWNGTTYDWKISTAGERWGTNGATDADEDIALALILADKLQAAGTWSANTTYAPKAQTMINLIYDKETVNSYLKPGDVWGGPDTMNLSYFAPTWYRIFDEYETINHNWTGVIDKQYDILLTTAKKYNGLIPDWQDQYGNQVNGSWGMRYDGIRVPWRIGLDAVVHKDSRATQYVDLVTPYVMNKGGASQVKMYSIPDGSAIEWHNELAVAMWAAGAIGGSNTTYRDQLSSELKNMYLPSIQAFGTWDKAHLYYFNQSLAMLGAAVIDGSFQKLLTNTIVALPTTSETNSTSNSTDTNTTSPDTGTTNDATSQQPVSEKQKFRKQGKVQHHKIIVKVAQTATEYQVRVYRKASGSMQLLKKKKYNESSGLDRITIRRQRVRLHHNNGLQKIIMVRL